MADSNNDAVLYEDRFIITAKDHRKYDRAARITANSIDEDSNTQLQLDINTELLDISPNTNIEVCLASTLSLDGSTDDDRGWRDVAKANVQTLADGYEYVCYGKIYKFEDSKTAHTLCVMPRQICASTTDKIGVQQGVCFVRRAAHVSRGPRQQARAAACGPRLPPDSTIG